MTEFMFSRFALACYLLTFIGALLPQGASRDGKQKKESRPSIPVLFLLAFLANTIAFFVRWQHVGYPPFSNLHEVMLLLTVFALPVFLYYRSADDVFLKGCISFGAFVYLFYPAVVSSGEPRPLMPALQSHWFIPHVSSYMIAYFMLTISGLVALRSLSAKHAGLLGLAHRITRHAFAFLTFGLISGAAWAQEAWGTYWGWDPKEVWSLISWMIYLIYFHYRLMPHSSRKIQAALLGLGLTAVLICFFVVNLSRIFAGLHSYSG